MLVLEYEMRMRSVQLATPVRARERMLFTDLEQHPGAVVLVDHSEARGLPKSKAN